MQRSGDAVTGKAMIGQSCPYSPLAGPVGVILPPKQRKPTRNADDVVETATNFRHEQLHLSSHDSPNIIYIPLKTIIADKTSQEVNKSRGDINITALSWERLKDAVRAQVGGHIDWPLHEDNAKFGGTPLAVADESELSLSPMRDVGMPGRKVHELKMGTGPIGDDIGKEA